MLRSWTGGGRAISTRSRRLLCVLAHPDDESLGVGGTLARYAAAGVETYLVTATRGERGRFGDNSNRPSPDEVGRVRSEELLAAAEVLGVREVNFLGYPDGALDEVDPGEATARIVAHVRRIQPDVVITFGPEGAYGHPDHIAISQLTSAALVCAADPCYLATGGGADRIPHHRTSKFYYIAWRKDKWDAYQAAFKKLSATVGGIERLVTPWPDWAVTTVIDTSTFAPAVWRAVCCHQTQITVYRKLQDLSPEHHNALWGVQEFYRVWSSVNGGRTLEADLFEGLK